MNKMTFIVPTFRAEKWIEKHKTFWKEVSKMVEVIVVEDSEEKLAKPICDELGIKYFSKPNGNWGSVINFAKQNKIIKTKYFAIVDADDVIELNELQKLLNSLDNKDFYITNVFKHSLKSNERKLINKSNFGKDRTVPFVHSIWIKTDMLYELPDLPNNTFYSDDLFVTFLQSKKDVSFEYVNCTPYVHYIDLPGQSISQYKNPKPDFAKNFHQYLNFDKYIGDTEHEVLQKNSNETAVYNLAILFSLTRRKDIKKLAKQKVKTFLKKLWMPYSFIWIYFHILRLWNTKTRVKLNKEW